MSVGWMSSTESIVDRDAGDTGAVFSVMGTTTFDGAQTFNDPVTLGSTLSVAGNTTLTGTAAIGAGTAIAKVVSSLISVGGAAVAGHESVTSAYLNNNAAVGDVVLLTPASIWSGAYGDLGYSGKVSTASTVDIAFVNSTLTSVTPDAMNFRCTLIRF